MLLAAVAQTYRLKRKLLVDTAVIDESNATIDVGATDVLESPGVESRGGVRALTFDLQCGPGTNILIRAVFPEPSIAGTREIRGRSYVVIRDGDRRVYVGLIGRPDAVSLIDDRFEPATLTVAAGTTVKWVNNGKHLHTVTSEAGRLRDSRQSRKSRMCARLMSPELPRRGSPCMR